MADLEATGPFAAISLPVEAGAARLGALPEAARAITLAPAAGGMRLTLNQWLVEGGGDVDVSDAFAGLTLTGADAAAVLARLVPIDLAALPEGAAARTELRHVPLVLAAAADGFILLVPRSYAAAAVAELTDAMHAVAARRAVAHG